MVARAHIKVRVHNKEHAPPVEAHVRGQEGSFGLQLWPETQVAHVPLKQRKGTHNCRKASPEDAYEKDWATLANLRNGHGCCCLLNLVQVFGRSIFSMLNYHVLSKQGCTAIRSIFL
eukprot:45093-Pelagomonas_calceolata.AAC.7